MKVWMVQLMDNNDAKLFSTEEKAISYAKQHYDNFETSNYISIDEVEVD
jgi:hypothetical protein